MAISYVGSASAAATSVTLPAHVAGDLIYIFTFRNGSTTAPTIPSGWLPIAGGPGANTCSFRQGFRIARGASETSGTWTNATHIIAVVMRGTLGIGNGNGNSGSSSTLNYPAWTLADSSGASWINAFAGHRTANNVDVAPTLLTNRTSVGSGPESAAHDSNGGVSSNWTSTNRTVSASSGWHTSIGEYLVYSDWVNYADSTYTRSNDCKTITSGVATPQCAWTAYPRNDKRVFAVTYTQTGGSTFPTIGIGDSAAGGTTTYRSGYLGGLGSIGLNANGDYYVNNTGPTASGVTFASGNKVFVAVDPSAELIWFKTGTGGNWNGSYTNAQVDAGTGGISIAALAAGFVWPGVSSDEIGDEFVYDANASGHGLTTFTAWDAASSQTLSPGLLTNTSTLYSPTVTRGAVTLTPGLLTNTNTLYAPTVTPGAVTLSPGLLTNSSAFYAPTVSQAGGTQTLTPGLLTNTNTFYSPTVSPGAVTLSPGLLSNANTFYAATVTQPGGGTLWTPADYAGGVLESWHDPSASGGLTVSGGTVSQDNDLSGNGYHDTQAFSVEQPAYTTGALNGLAVEDFSSDYFTSTLPTNPAIRTCMALVKWGGTGPETIWGGDQPGALQFRVYLGNPEFVSQNTALIGSGTGTAVASGTWAIVVGTYNQSTGAYSFRVNGTARGSGTNAQALTTATTYVGKQLYGENWSGPIAERVTLTVVTTSEIELFEGYVAWKYGLEGDLDAGHPYKSAAPTVTGGSQTLNPGLFTNTNAFYAPTVTTGAVTLTPGLLTNSSTFYAPTVTQSGGPQTLTPGLLTNSNTFYAPTVTPGAVALSAGLLTNASEFYAPTVSLLSFPQTLTAGLLTNVNAFYAPTVTGGEIIVVVTPLARTVRVLAEYRTARVLAEQRTVAVAAENRTVTAESADRQAA